MVSIDLTETVSAQSRAYTVHLTVICTNTRIHTHQADKVRDHQMPVMICISYLSLKCTQVHNMVLQPACIFLHDTVHFFCLLTGKNNLMWKFV